MVGCAATTGEQGVIACMRWWWQVSQAQVTSRSSAVVGGWGQRQAPKVIWLRGDWKRENSDRWKSSESERCWWPKLDPAPRPCRCLSGDSEPGR